MIVKRAAIMDAYTAFETGSFDTNQKMPAVLAYKIYKNLDAIKPVYRSMFDDIGILQKQYDWKQGDPYGGLDSDTYNEYLKKYNAILDGEVELDIIPIRMSELTQTFAITEMEVLFFMITPYENREDNT